MCVHVFRCVNMYVCVRVNMSVGPLITKIIMCSHIFLLEQPNAMKNVRQLLHVGLRYVKAAHEASHTVHTIFT